MAVGAGLSGNMSRDHIIVAMEKEVLAMAATTWDLHLLRLLHLGAATSNDLGQRVWL